MDTMDYFLNEKPAETLVLIHISEQEVFNSKISQEIDTTYSHTVEIVQTLESEDLISTEKRGRKKISKLTEKGESYAEAFENLFSVMKEDTILQRR